MLNDVLFSLFLFSLSIITPSQATCNLWPVSKFAQQLPSTCKTGFATDATCNLQQCWELLDNNVASVCTGLWMTICLIINLVNYFSYLAQVLYGWNLTVVNTTFSSILIRWANLTSLLCNRKVGHYVVFLNRRNNSVAFHQVVDGDQLTMEIKGLTHLTNYTVEVVGIDTQRKPYKTPSEAIMTANRKSKYFK